MRKEIKGWALEIAFDEKYSRFFLLGTRAVWVYDVNTLKKIGKLENLPYRNHIFISQKNDLIIVSSTAGAFCFYSLNDFQLRGKVNIKGCGNTDEAFYYDEEENAVYGIYTKSLKYYLYRISLETLQYWVIPLHDLYDNPRTRYKFHKYCNGSYYLLVENDDSDGNARDEMFYGRYEREGERILLKEKLLFFQNKYLPLYYITEPEFAEKIYEFEKSLDMRQDGPIQKTYHNQNGFFLITYRRIFHMNENGEFETIYYAGRSPKYPHFYENISDYAEYCGRTYICTSEKCLIYSSKT